jgi:hypothetical protein
MPPFSPARGGRRRDIVRDSTMNHPSTAFLLGLFVAAPTATLTAQWSNNPAQNLSVADGAGEQVLGKLAATTDGGCYIGWFDNRNGTYEVRLQRLDAAGVEQWGHNGILVSNNPQSSSLVDWDLICDTEDHCVLAFTDTRAGGDLDIYAYRFSPAGASVWGPNGVALSNNADYEPNPRICEASDGDFVFVWANTGLRTLQLQRLDRSGVARFAGDGVSIPGETGATPGFCDVVAADLGAVVVSWVRTITFTGNKHIHAQKFDVLGNAVWNAGQRLAVFDQGSVPIAHDPRLLPDGTGGAVLAWHFAVGQLFSCRVQHVLGTGVEAFPHNGVDVSTSTGSKFDPAIVHDLQSGETFVAWNERNLAQSQWGIFVQKLDPAGALSWGSAGITLLPINTTVKFAPVAAPLGTGCAVAVLEESLGNMQKKVVAWALDAAGNLLWTPQVDACTVASDKLRMQIATTPSGTTQIVWTDHRSGTPDTFVQAIDLAGGLGPTLGTVVAYGCSGSPAGSLTLSARPAIGTTPTFGLQNPVGTQAPGSLAFLVLSMLPDPSPCGTPQPGFGMFGPSVPGELLVNPGFAVSVYGGQWPGPNQTASVPFAIPHGTWLLQVQVFAQGALFDPTPAALVPIGLSNGLQLTIGS